MKLPDIGESSLGAPQPSLSVARYQPESAADLEALGQAQIGTGQARVGTGQALVGLGNAVQQQVDRIGTLQAEDRYTQLRNWQLNALSGQNGLLTLKGAASVNGPSLDDASANFEDAAKKFGDGLVGVGAQLYQQRAQISGLQFKEQVLRHQTEQSVLWSKSVTDAGVQSEIDQIGANYRSDGLIGASLARINGLIDAHAADPNVGWSRGQTDIAKKLAIEKAETARWQAWSLDDPVGAYANFKANQGIVTDPAVRVRLDHELKSLAYPVQGDAIAQKAIAEATTHPTEAPGVPATPSLPGFRGDPTDVANQLSRVLSSPGAARLDPKLVAATIDIESGGDVNAKNPRSSASGLMQVTAPTWVRMGGGARGDVGEEIRVGTKYLAQVQQDMAQSLGRAPANWETYLAYQQGPAGARALLSNPQANAVDALAPAYRGNRDRAEAAIVNNGGDPDSTAAEFTALWRKNYEAHEALAAAGGAAGADGQDFGKTDVMAQYGRMLDAVKTAAGGDYQLEQHALQSLHARLTDMVKSQDAIFAHNHDTVLKELTFDGSPGPLSVSALSPAAQVAYQQMTPGQQMSIQENMLESGRIQRGEKGNSDPGVFNQLLQRVYLDPGDPNQIRTRADLVPYMTSGQIQFSDFQHLASEIDHAHTPEGNAFGKQVNRVKADAAKMLETSLTGPSLRYPELAQEAAYRFGADLDNRLQAARAAGEDLQTYFTPGSKNYALDPNRVMAFMPNEQQITAYKARAMAAPVSTAPSPVGIPRKPGETPAEYLSRIGK